MPKQLSTPQRAARSTRSSPVKPKPNRQPAHCTKCDGRPLRSQCPHTKPGRLYLQQIQEKGQLEEDQPSEGLHNQPSNSQDRVSEPVQGPREREASRCNKCVGRPLRTQCSHTKAGEAYLHEQGVLADLVSHADQLSSPSPSRHPFNGNIDPNLFHRLGSNRNNSPAASAHAQSPQRTLRPTQTHEWIFPSPTIHDTANQGRDITPTAPTTPATHEVHTPINRMSHSAGVPENSVAENQGEGSGEARRARATAANPIYGLVEDVFRGDQRHAIHRSHALSGKIHNREKCQKYFLETFNSIVARCEDLSARTGCWLFVGAQHATARGATIHFASPRLRRDAGDALDSFAEEFCTLMNEMTDVRRRDTLEVRRNLEEVESAKAALEKEVEVLQNKNADRDALLRRYKDLFGDVVTSTV